MTVYNRGDVVLIGFVFSDETTKKLRPAVVISSAAYNRSRQEIICRGYDEQHQTPSLWRSCGSGLDSCSHRW